MNTERMLDYQPVRKNGKRRPRSASAASRRQQQSSYAAALGLQQSGPTAAQQKLQVRVQQQAAQQQQLLRVMMPSSADGYAPSTHTYRDLEMAALRAENSSLAARCERLERALEAEASGR